MVSATKRLRLGGMAVLAFLVAMVFAAQAAYPPEVNLSVDKSAPAEVNPGEIFNYVITVTNPGPNDAPEVVVTDKLPYEVTNGTIVVDPLLGPSSISKTGDLIYFRFDEIPAGQTGTITIPVTAPAEAPTTLYNIVNLRYGNDPDTSNNRVTVPTYVVQVGYNQTLAAFSFEDLLHNQSQLLFQFEDLMHTIPETAEDRYNFSVSFEQLLRSQAALTSSFEDLLTNESQTGWDTDYTEENRTALLWSYEQMLYEEAFLFASFNVMINDSWMDFCTYTADGHTQDAQTELLASFEDLLHRQNRLYKSFDLLLNKIDLTEPGAEDSMIDFLAAYENLLRIEANLYMSFYNLLNMKYENNPCGAAPLDTDGDGVADASDNCPSVANPDQADGDADGVGELCDNCPGVANPGQEDTDGDDAGDACDP